jgi:hypothetical protein
MLEQFKKQLKGQKKLTKKAVGELKGKSHFGTRYERGDRIVHAIFQIPSKDSNSYVINFQLKPVRECEIELLDDDADYFYSEEHGNETYPAFLLKSLWKDFTPQEPS